MVSHALGELIETLGSIDDDEIDWQNVRQTTVVVHQTFRYDYPAPVSEVRQRLMVVPPDYHGHQRLVTHKLRVTGRNLDSERHYDSFGNVVLDLSLEDLDDTYVEFSTWAVVECEFPADGTETGDELPIDRRYGQPSRLTESDDALREEATGLVGSGGMEVDLAALICARVHDRLSYESGATTVQTTAAEAWALGRGVCQDYAHCMLALCRACGLSARYVSGHLLGEGGTHAWVEVLAPQPDGLCRAVAFDPTHGRRPDARYLIVAVGRDYVDVAPTSGTFTGVGPGELSTHKHAAVIRVEYLQPARRRRPAPG